jgi:hypothetical protein
MEDNRLTIFIEQMSELYGMRAHSVARRTREIGVRLASGGRRCDVWMCPAE